jgi:hypothetical protein
MSVTWRESKREDVPAIHRVWDAHDRMLEEIAPTIKAPRPELFMQEGKEGPWGPYQPPIIRVRVAERDGEIVACMLIEAVAEVQLVGADQEVVDRWRRNCLKSVTGQKRWGSNRAGDWYLKSW